MPLLVDIPMCPPHTIFNAFSQSMPSTIGCNQSLCARISTHHLLISIHTFHLQCFAIETRKCHYLQPCMVDQTAVACCMLIGWWPNAGCSLFAVMDHKLPSPIIWNQNCPPKSEMESGAAFYKIEEINYTITLQMYQVYYQLLFDHHGFAKKGVITTESWIWNTHCHIISRILHGKEINWSDTLPYIWGPTCSWKGSWLLG